MELLTKLIKYVHEQYVSVSVQMIYMYKTKRAGSVVMWQEIPDWSKFGGGRGLENAVELLTCKCSFST